MTFDQFVKEIQTYESDTFSAEGSGITQNEAVKVAESILGTYVEYKLDGDKIDGHLCKIRDN